MERDDFLKELLNKNSTPILSDDFTDKLMEKIMLEEDPEALHESVLRKWWFWLSVFAVMLAAVAFILWMPGFNMLRSFALKPESFLGGIESFFQSVTSIWNSFKGYPIAFIVIFATLILLGFDRILKRFFQHKTTFVWLV